MTERLRTTQWEHFISFSFSFHFYIENKRMMEVEMTTMLMIEKFFPLILLHFALLCESRELNF